MDRRAWLDGRRAVVEQTYDAEAPEYDRYDDEITPTHRRFVERLLVTCPPGGIVLDAPCGTGKYFGLVAAAGRRVVGADHSTGMLAQARSKGTATTLHRTILQELHFDADFDAIMTVDAIENVPPEDWPRVLANLHRAVRRGGHLYLTVEELDDPDELDRAFADGAAHGLPIVHGEVIEGDTAGYHYYPGREKVMGWLASEGLTVLDEDFNQEDGWGYRHFLMRASDARALVAVRSGDGRLALG